LAFDQWRRQLDGLERDDHDLLVGAGSTGNNSYDDRDDPGPQS
jgi:hypothetical protein